MTRRTSRDAYYSIKENGLLSKRRFEVYEYVYLNGPCTAREAYKDLCKGSQINPSSYLSRFSELRDLGVLEEVGERFDSETKQTVILWDVTDAMPSKVKKPDQIKCSYCKGKGYVTQGRLL